LKRAAFVFLAIVLVAFVFPASSWAMAAPEQVSLTVVEMASDRGVISAFSIPPSDDSSTNGDYRLLRYHWTTTAAYWVNTANPYGLDPSGVLDAVRASAETWDAETTFAVFSYSGTTTSSAGVRDGLNVVSFGSYKAGVIGVTFIWSTRNRVVETDTMLNTYYVWSLTGEPGKMDVQNIMTHEFGHWAGLADLYKDRDYWLTMYGYSNFGITYQRTLGLGDVLGLRAVYGP